MRSGLFGAAHGISFLYIIAAMNINTRYLFVVSLAAFDIQIIIIVI
jgi:hypothetical protein